MPRKTKDEEINIDVVKKSSKVAPKKTSKTKKEDAKKSTSSKKTTENVETKKGTKNSKENTAKTSVAKKSTAKKSSVSKTTKKSTTSKKNTASKNKSGSSKSTKTTSKSNKTSARTSKKILASAEYYDLPTSYHQTIVKILAQTPSCLFVYWEIAEKDKLKFKKEYGNDFFENSKPYLIIINETMNYSFEIEINDYANSWYIHINDSDCKYTVNLIRKPILHQTTISTTFVNITSSNEISAPNNHILFDKLGKTVFFRNVQNNTIVKKDISSISFISNIGRIYNIYDLYKEIYKNELNGDELGTGLSSSGFSSTFK